MSKIELSIIYSIVEPVMAENSNIPLSYAIIKSIIKDDTKLQDKLKSKLILINQKKR